MNKKVLTKELFENVPEILEPLFSGSKYPWEILGKIKGFIKTVFDNIPDGYSLLSDGILVGENVGISPLATIIPPCIIGSGTEVRPGAYLRGNVIIGENCVIGNSSELKNCIVLDKAQVPHYNYIGDSVLGTHAHMGAGSICSNLKADGREVKVRADEVYDSHLRKFGAILADGVDVGCGCVLNPGTVIGKNTSVYPLTSVRGVIGEDLIVKSMDNIVKRKPYGEEI